MKLSWTSPEDWVWTSTSPYFTYVVHMVSEVDVFPDKPAVTVHRWSVSQIRRTTGQQIRESRLDTLEGAFARAHVWENI